MSSQPFYYPTDLTIQYSDNEGYRDCLRRLFLMKTDKIQNSETEDDETEDENLYDFEATIIALDYLFSKTKDDVVFQELYDKAAALLFSTVRDHGLSVLLSYDYLATFHPLLSWYFNEKAI